MVIGADYAAFEDREKVFDRVGVVESASANILSGAVIDRAMAGKLAAHRS
jgi:hypothetical protein